MFTRRAILSRPTYWLTENRLDFMRAVADYMERNHLNRKKLAAYLHCSPSYVSQILNGDTNLSQEKLYDIALAIGKVPLMRYEDLEIVLQRDSIQCGHAYEVVSTAAKTMPLAPPAPARQFTVSQSFNTRAVAAPNLQPA